MSFNKMLKMLINIKNVFFYKNDSIYKAKRYKNF